MYEVEAQTSENPGKLSPNPVLIQGLMFISPTRSISLRHDLTVSIVLGFKESKTKSDPMVSLAILSLSTFPVPSKGG